MLLENFARAALATFLRHAVAVVAFTRRAENDLGLLTLCVCGAVSTLAHPFCLVVERHDLRLLLRSPAAL